MTSKHTSPEARPANEDWTIPAARIRPRLESTPTTLRVKTPERRAPTVADAETVEDLEAQIEYWRMRWDEERGRIAKIWVAYEDMELELEGTHRELREARLELARMKANVKKA